LRRMAAATGIHTTTLSQAIKGKRPFSPEQVAKICEYLGFSDLETRYALAQLHFERAGTEQLRKILKAELASLRRQAEDLTHVVRKDKVLTESDKAIFYSNWYYSAIAVLSSLEGFQDVPAISSRTSLPKPVINQAIEFLLNSGICVKRGSRLEPGTKSTHLEASSPLVVRHHGNWRLRAIERHSNLNSTLELAYSSPMSLSLSDAIKIRSMLIELVKKVNQIRDPSPCEDAYFLNIDWLRI